MEHWSVSEHNSIKHIGVCPAGIQYDFDVIFWGTAIFCECYFSHDYLARIDEENNRPYKNQQSPTSRIKEARVMIRSVNVCDGANDKNNSISICDSSFPTMQQK